MVNPFRKVGKTVLYVTLLGVGAVAISKTIIRSRRDSKFKPYAISGENQLGNKDEVKDYYNDIAHIKPGFPLPKDYSNDSKNDESDRNVQFTRKSEYEGGGLSVLSRKGGDKLGFWDRRRKD
ncbi:hypothetical protein TBLA_0A02640 [Henningerozyma blattae CBS 6284]|uniref:Uncharacterized protein n=1 Tax=Henningerozyma blattae (strain ATCC 34711 / CBS 6284 / DSM 70876 / NBRC 10599 / NRRL Y-10934 / UCD 77-7) TaxID=1071380 RepID=I2GVB1_HENB6|nr:hypothetical protein TBLA_0A02640 [Tetrapisispora blattae CBS 6284]CCH58063.1 hypothetical protein TBLA_0A02640 [Tetrapisispora blattae CBS 6284]